MCVTKIKIPWKGVGKRSKIVNSASTGHKGSKNCTRKCSKYKTVETNANSHYLLKCNLLSLRSKQATVRDTTMHSGSEFQTLITLIAKKWPSLLQATHCSFSLILLAVVWDTSEQHWIRALQSILTMLWTMKYFSAYDQYIVRQNYHLTRTPHSHCRHSKRPLCVSNSKFLGKGLELRGARWKSVR